MARVSKTKRQDTYLRRKYGITLAQKKSMLKAQNHLCAICNGDNGGKTLNVDHDHKTKKVRGLLCFRCNKYIIGRHRDGKLLRAAANYLDKRKVPGL